MIRNDEVQAALIGYAKANATIVASLPAGATEIRENEWQGRDFVYPNIRLRLISNIPQSMSKECTQARVRLAWMVFSESSNSLESDQITGIIYNELHRKSFIYSGIQFYFRSVDLIPAVRVDYRTWRSELLMEGTIAKVV